MNHSKISAVIEIFLVFGAAALVIVVGLPFAGDSLFAKQLVVVAANIAMLTVVGVGMYRRGQGFEYLGLSFTFGGWKSLALGFAKSLAVLVLGVAGFIFGSIVMANITGIPEQADVSGYNYLQGNLPLLLVSLTSIYVVSSFGEEVIYRGYLINRIEEILGGSRRALWAAVVMSSIIFGIAHFGWGIVGVVQTGFMGLAFAASYILFRRNLWILVAAHAYMDTALIVPLYFAQ
ncbi:MAG: CPBP family intramembrane metalloprotease [Xanthomonadales bacterium]|nr:CPBP family intramembrane metalloprotease [Gammaproteobacteria bacterium]MBT8053775.1 CPBP family intramembrane metalloprotease [Gammaproteobacteria bacterium]NND57282.1 CPBP family intramembrane metalloprotease [Xanthomonadales bacterium]NNK51612.1 CPBP family intramembrane metalloprotease [Xanthomonadales bacterium]